MLPPPPRLQPAIYGGLFIGVLSALPLINIGNCFCCMWVIGGGLLTTYLMQQNYPYPIKVEDALLGGLLAGVIGGAVSTILSIPMAMMMGGYQARMLERLASNPDMPEQTRQLLENFATNSLAFGAIRLVAGLISVAVDAVFGMLGGLLGVALFRKKDVPPAPGTTEVLPPA